MCVRVWQNIPYCEYTRTAEVHDRASARSAELNARRLRNKGLQKMKRQYPSYNFLVIVVALHEASRVAMEPCAERVAPLVDQLQPGGEQTKK